MRTGNKFLKKNFKKTTIHFYITLATVLFFTTNYGDQRTEKPMVVVIPSYNNMKWYEKNLVMLAAQNKKYSNWRAIYIDDCSKDGTGAAVEKYIADNNLSNKITLIKNAENHGALYNLYHAIHSCKNDEIIVTLDGDDWFPDNEVLKYLNEVYQDGEVWITYGQYLEYPSGKIGTYCEQIPNFVIEQNSFRNYKWVSSHLRTFYAGLFKKIKKEDLMFDGKFYPMTWDLAMMFPMFEMAGFHAKFINKVLYIYNFTNPISDWRKDTQLILSLEKQIRKKEKYKRIDSIN
jgi:glycosyltransferase involved in cell wall biosynthesis